MIDLHCRVFILLFVSLEWPRIFSYDFAPSSYNRVCVFSFVVVVVIVVVVTCCF